MCNKLGFKKRFPFVASVKGDPTIINKWLIEHYGADTLALPSGKAVKVSKKEGVWAYDDRGFEWCTYRFCKPEYVTFFLLRWS